MIYDESSPEGPPEPEEAEPQPPAQESGTRRWAGPDDPRRSTERRVSR